MNRLDHITPLPPDLQALLSGMPVDEQAELMEAWFMAGEAETPDAARKAEVWQSTRRQAFGRPALRLVPNMLRVRGIRAYAVAAVVVVLIGFFAILESDIRIEAPTGADAMTAVALPDGSSVDLSPGTMLRYARTFGEDHRTLYLEGEAFFDVLPDEGRPFVVETFNAGVEVLGTAFNVRAWPDEGERDTEVYVARGLVRVALTDSPVLDVRLRAGEASSVVGSSLPLPPSQMEQESALAWRNGGMAFSNALIGDVLREVERRFNVSIKAHEDIRRGRITFFKHSITNVEEVMGDIVDATDLRYRKILRGYEVYVP